MIIIQKCVHNLVLRIAVSYWYWQCLCIMKSFNIIDGWLTSFMCNLLESSIIPTFICNSHICTMWLQFFKTFNSIFWELINQSPDLHITISIQKVSNGLFCIILNIPPPPFLGNLEGLHKFLYIEKNYIKWVNKGDKIDPTLKWILIQFEPDNLRFICCCRKFFR